ncbi:hypothetical protein AURDEDRAFT_159862 [Auricularia subglabra TFB-10046 SS5]|nr:hypothetical protein AURDEDRAFT_159862 [Auricularia subglabra TFB-10046 SS5]
MFSKALTVFALAAAAVAFPARGGLTVSISAPKNVDSVDDVTVVASVTNTGKEDVKVINIGTVLDSKLPTKSFTVTKDGQEASFTGLKLMLDMENLTEDSYTVIPAGQTVSVKHEIAALFDFESLGTGAFSIEPVDHLPIVVADAVDGSRPTLRPYELPSAKASFSVAKDVAKRTLPQKRSRVTCSNSSQNSFISASYTEGKQLASLASSYIASNGANSLYTSYFKTTSTSNVRGVFNGVANENSSSRTLSCTDPYGVCNGNVIAYTVTSTTNIYYCSIFYNEVASSRLCSGTTVASRNVRGGTTLHELTHAVSGTTDVGYGCAFDQSLSASQAYRNADNYNCFATQVYQNTQC